MHLSLRYSLRFYLRLSLRYSLRCSSHFPLRYYFSYSLNYIYLFIDVYIYLSSFRHRVDGLNRSARRLTILQAGLLSLFHNLSRRHLQQKVVYSFSVPTFQRLLLQSYITNVITETYSRARLFRTRFEQLAMSTRSQFPLVFLSIGIKHVTANSVFSNYSPPRTNFSSERK